MKKLFFIIVLVGVTLSCSADNYRYRDSDNYYQHSQFWKRIDRRLLRQYHRIDEGLEHGRLTRHQAHKLFRHINRLEQYIEEQRCDNRTGFVRRHNILRHLNRNEQRINKYLNRRHGKFRYQSHYDNPYNLNTFIPSRGIQWSMGSSSGVLYFGY